MIAILLCPCAEGSGVGDRPFAPNLAKAIPEKENPVEVPTGLDEQLPAC